VILSTGMSSLLEVEQAVAVIQGSGNRKLALLHCVSAYPAEAGEANLRAMRTMARTFGVPIGYSDHTMGLEVSLAAVALGACMLEKHFTLDRTLPGPDHRASLEPGELQALVRSVRKVEDALGTGRKEPAACETETMLVSRKSMVAACDIPAGTSVTRNLIAMKNPGTGWPPSMLQRVVGRVAVRNISANTLLTEEMFR
jgi:sialic acid synthase SpsE